MFRVLKPSPLTKYPTLWRNDLFFKFRSVLNMLQHLTGQVVPGIACCRTFSGDLTQRTQELLNQHQAVLTFLRSTISSMKISNWNLQIWFIRQITSVTNCLLSFFNYNWHEETGHSSCIFRLIALKANFENQMLRLHVQDTRSACESHQTGIFTGRPGV